jgi:hypothetical protein
MSLHGDKRKLLFAISSDYGELSTALDFLAGQPFDAELLLPERLFRVHASSLPVACRMSHSPADILAAVAEKTPDVVFLFSGYLYAINGLFPIDGVRQLVDALCSTSCAVVTSDPFLGELFRLDGSTFSEQHPARRQLAEHFARIVPILAGAKHLYRGTPRAGAAGGSVSFYNPQTVLDEAARFAWKNRALRTPGIRPELKRWLFVLSAEDYAAGTARWGKARFDENLRGKLLETAMAGRQPVMIGPPACIEAMRQGELTPVTALLFEFCEQAQFLSLLHEAEYCFYWNVFSHSIIARVMNRGPVFFFDCGHLVHALPSFLDAGLEHFYAGWRPRRLEQNDVLSAGQLAEFAVEDDRSLEPARLNFARSPSPVEMVEDVLRRAKS